MFTTQDIHIIKGLIRIIRRDWRKFDKQDIALLKKIQKVLLCYKNSIQNWSRANFDESKVSRDEEGKFTSGSKKFTKTSKYDRINNRVRKELRLPKHEYAKVIHELNTNLTVVQRKKKIITKYIGSYKYRIRNNGFNEYEIIYKGQI